MAIDGMDSRIHSIEFRNVGFAYKDGQPVLRDFNLRVQAGESIALVGPTGGGKTTIVGLACRFYEPTSGQILINGLDYRERSLKWLQSNLGMVLQQPYLFSGTVRENIRYGRLSATDDEIVPRGQIDRGSRIHRSRSRTATTLQSVKAATSFQPGKNS